EHSVIVNHEIAKSAETSPVDPWILCPYVGCQTLCRLGHDLEVSDDGVLNHLVCKVGVTSVLRIPPNPLDALQNLHQIQTVVLCTGHSGRASAMTRSRMTQ